VKSHHVASQQARWPPHHLDGKPGSIIRTGTDRSYVH
jgi:hypothetical protein